MIQKIKSEPYFIYILSNLTQPGHTGYFFFCIILQKILCQRSFSTQIRHLFLQNNTKEEITGLARFDEAWKNENKVRSWFYLLNHFLYLCLTNNQTMRTWYAYLIKINVKKRDKIKDNFTPEKVSVRPLIFR